MAGYAYYSSPTGILKLEYEDGAVTALHRVAAADTVDAPNALTAQAFRQLDAYFAGVRRSFDFPYWLRGTPFQQAVWAALLAIPYGQTRSYRDIAAAIGRPKACRAVGMANNRNPNLIVIPCHRVIGADGALAGYGGGLEMKRALLTLEAENSR